MSPVKASQLAGRWYPGDALQLQTQVDGLLHAAPPQPSGERVLGIVVPHAAYQYSGRAAAAGYACLHSEMYDRVVVVAPSHFNRFHGIALTDAQAFATPLGTLAVDVAAVAALRERPLFHDHPLAYEGEHSLEIQLPFVQRALPGATLVPVLVGDVTPDDAATIATAWAPLANPRTVFIISSDFVHYGQDFRYLPFPSAGVDAVRAGLRDLDMGAIERVCAADASGFWQYIAHTGATICGRNPIALFLTFLPPAARGRLLAYYTSLDVTGDYEHSVSYASIAFPATDLDSTGAA